MRSLGSIITAVFAVLVFAAGAAAAHAPAAGHVQVKDQNIEWLSSNEDMSRYSWQVELRSSTMCPKNVDFSVNFYDSEGHIVDTVQSSAYLRGKGVKHIQEQGTADFNAREVADTEIKLLDVRSLNR